MTKEDAIESYKKSVELCKARLDVEKMRMDIGEIKELEFYIERDEMAIQALSQESSRNIKEIAEIMKCDADAETKCKMISNILTAKPHYFERQDLSDVAVSRGIVLDKSGKWITNVRKRR